MERWHSGPVVHHPLSIQGLEKSSERGRYVFNDSSLSSCAGTVPQAILLASPPSSRYAGECPIRTLFHFGFRQFFHRDGRNNWLRILLRGHGHRFDRRRKHRLESSVGDDTWPLTICVSPGGARPFYSFCLSR